MEISLEMVYTNCELNFVIVLFNNVPKIKEYEIKILAPGFDPKGIVLDIKVEGRGSF